MRKITLEELQMNPFLKIQTEKALITAGSQEKFNTMTIGWATFGILWRKPVTTIYVRHSRFTHMFTEQNDCYAIVFLKPGHEREIGILGTKSGRDMDKMHASGLTPVFVDGVTTFEEAAITIICRKIYQDEITAEKFLDDGKIMEDCYATGDMHTVYTGEVLAVYENS